MAKEIPSNKNTGICDPQLTSGRIKLPVSVIRVPGGGTFPTKRALDRHDIWSWLGSQLKRNVWRPLPSDGLCSTSARLGSVAIVPLIIFQHPMISKNVNFGAVPKRDSRLFGVSALYSAVADGEISDGASLALPPSLKLRRDKQPPRGAAFFIGSQSRAASFGGIQPAHGWAGFQGMQSFGSGFARATVLAGRCNRPWTGVPRGQSAPFGEGRCASNV